MAAGRTLLAWGAALISRVTVALFAIGFVSAYLPPAWFWWTGLPASLLPFIAMAAAGLLLVHALLRDAGWAAVHLGVVGLFVMRAGLPGGIGPAASPTAPPETAGTALTVMSFNYTPQAHVGGELPVLRDAVGRLATTYTPDLIAMQSARVFQRRGQMRLINGLDTLATTGYRVRPEPAYTQRLDTRVPIFSRVPTAVRQGEIVLQAQQDTDRHIRRAELEWQGTPIVVYNVHLRSFERGHALDLLEDERYGAALRELVAVYRRDVLRRVQEVRELRERLSNETRPTLLVGDLNASPFNWEYRHLRTALHDAPARLGGNWQFTWHTQRPLARIDHVLTSAHWEPLSVQVDSTRISDHFPIVVRLRLRKDGAGGG